MGPGSESTLRFDEPLHLMFLVAYLITYFCCAYILFVCFKQCRRLVQRKPARPVSLSRLRSIAEALNNLPCRTTQISRNTSSRQVQVSLCNLGGTHAVLCPQYDEGDRSQMSISESAETNSSSLSPLQMTTFTFRRIYYRGGQHHAPFACFIMDEGESGDDDELPEYEAVSSNSLPPSYSTCVLSTHAQAQAAGQNTFSTANESESTTTIKKADAGHETCDEKQEQDNKVTETETV